MSKPSAVLFDAYGTLFDVHSVTALAESFFAGQGQALSVLWRDKQIEYSRLVTTSDDGAHYQPFSELTRAGLRYACQRLTLDLTAERETALMAQYLRLTPYPEVREVLEALRARGVVTGILSNGNPAMLAPLVCNAGLEELFDHVISTDAVRTFKTNPAAYRLGARVTGLHTADIAFVSSNGWDALAATWFGFRTLWINRLGLPPEAIGPAPERTGSSLHDVLSFF